MNCPYCGKEIKEKEIHVKRFDSDVYIDGVPFSVLGIESLTDPAEQRRGVRVVGRIAHPPVIVYVEAE